MENTIVTDLHTILQEYQKSTSSYDAQKLNELGANSAKQIIKLPMEEQALAWNIVAQAIDGQAKNSEKSDTVFKKEIGKGAMSAILHDDERDALIQGITYFNLGGKMEYKDTPAAPKDVPPAIDYSRITPEHSEAVHNMITAFKDANLINDPEKLKELGVKAGKEIFNFPPSEQIVAWTILGDAFDTVAKKSIAEGVSAFPYTEEQRSDFIDGITGYDRFVKNPIPEPSSTKTNKPR